MNPQCVEKVFAHHTHFPIVLSCSRGVSFFCAVICLLFPFSPWKGNLLYCGIRLRLLPPSFEVSFRLGGPRIFLTPFFNRRRLGPPPFPDTHKKASQLDMTPPLPIEVERVAASRRLSFKMLVWAGYLSHLIVRLTTAFLPQFSPCGALDASRSSAEPGDIFLTIRLAMPVPSPDRLAALEPVL